MESSAGVRQRLRVLVILLAATLCLTLFLIPGALERAILPFSGTEARIEILGRAREARDFELIAKIASLDDERPAGRALHILAEDFFESELSLELLIRALQQTNGRRRAAVYGLARICEVRELSDQEVARLLVALEKIPGDIEPRTREAWQELKARTERMVEIKKGAVEKNGLEKSRASQGE